MAAIGVIAMVAGTYTVGVGCGSEGTCEGTWWPVTLLGLVGLSLLLRLIWSSLSGYALALTFAAGGVGLLAAAINVDAVGRGLAAVVLLAVGGLVAAFAWGVHGVGTGVEYRNRQGVATVLSVRDTRWTVNDRPHVKVRLRIQPSGGGRPYEDERGHTVLAVPRPGEQYRVTYGRDFMRLDELLPPKHGADRSVPVPTAIDMLTKLDALRLSGALTEAEFLAQKRRVLAETPDTPQHTASTSADWVAEPGRDEYAHRFGGSEWSIDIPEGSFPPPITLLTLELKDPRLELGSDLRALPLCSRVDGTRPDHQAYVIDPVERTVTFEGPRWQAGDGSAESLRVPAKARLLRLRELRPEEDPRHSPETALRTFVGGDAFLRIGGNPPWPDGEKSVTCTCRRRAALVAAIGSENDDHRSGLLTLDQPSSFDNLLRYFFVCLPCRRVVVLTQPT